MLLLLLLFRHSGTRICRITLQSKNKTNGMLYIPAVAAAAELYEELKKFGLKKSFLI